MHGDSARFPGTRFALVPTILSQKESRNMPESNSNDERTAASLQAGLHDLAKAVRQADHLSPETQRTLPDLVDELGGSVRPEKLSPAETAHLTENLAHLTQPLQPGEGPS